MLCYACHYKKSAYCNYTTSFILLLPALNYRKILREKPKVYMKKQKKNKKWLMKLSQIIQTNLCLGFVTFNQKLPISVTLCYYKSKSIYQ